jgi:hypothetical protein
MEYVVILDTRILFYQCTHSWLINAYDYLELCLSLRIEIYNTLIMVMVHVFPWLNGLVTYNCLRNEKVNIYDS